jgi:hypothetical protein
MFSGIIFFPHGLIVLEALVSRMLVAFESLPKDIKGHCGCAEASPRFISAASIESYSRINP